MQLWTFYENLMRMLDAWFEDADMDEKAAFMTQFIFSSGSWGSKEHAAIAHVYRATKRTDSVAVSKIKLTLRAIFPQISALKRRYPILEKAPWLYPVMWLVRCVTAVCCRRDSIRINQQYIATMTADNIESFEQALEYVGLEYRI